MVRTNGLRVLVAEDDFLISEEIRRSLEKIGFAFAGDAATGAEAVELACQTRPDVVLMDVSLGEMSGIEATRHILVRNPGIKVIGLSVNNDRAMAEAMRVAGAVAYLTKSGSSSALIETIRSCVRGVAY